MTTIIREGWGDKLRAHMDHGVVACPGAFNGLVARAVSQTGFDACYVSGAAVSGAAGVPDVGLLTLDRFTQVIEEVVRGAQLPVMADADTGFGEEEMTRRTVLAYARAGAAGLHIEDQVFPKRCGHLDGKTLVAVDHMVSKVEWAAQAARDAGGGFIVCARTDARGVDGFDAAVERAKAYTEAGADMIFPEGLTSEDEFARFAKALPDRESGGPYLLANMTEFGKTPMIGLDRFGAMGYHLVIYPVTTLRIAMGAVTEALAQLKAHGSAEPLLSRMQTREELYHMLGYTPGTPWHTPRM